MSEAQKMKILVIRFSSFGDILAVLSVFAALHEKFPLAELHWLTRKDFEEIANAGKNVDRVWAVDKKQGFAGLQKIITQLRQEKFTHVYDAHNNLRSHWVSWRLRGPLKFLRRSQYRWRRFLLFRFHINKYPKPFVHQWALLEPLARWGVPLTLPPPPLLQIPQKIQQECQQRLSGLRNSVVVALSPSASYELKRWPVSHWQELVRQNPQWNFVALGGPDDQFIEQITAVAPERCLNMAGKLSYLQSAGMVWAADLLVSNDTGLMHVAEQLGKPCVALLGPAPFGHPGRSTTLIKERELECRPCSKHGQGPCVNSVYQKCLADISAGEVASGIQKLAVR